MDLRTDHAVVVLNPHYTGLGIARNLGPLGVRVLGVTATASFPGNHSRWLQYRRMPDSAAEPEALRDALLALAVEEAKPPVLFPTRDQDIAFVCAQRHALQDAFLIPFSDNDVIDAVMNKDRLLARASELGIGVPRTETLTGLEELPRAKGLGYPVVCKPPYAAQWRLPEIWELVGREKAVRIESFPALEEFYRRIAARDPLMNVQEWIPGDERNLLIFGSYRTAGGELPAWFTARKRLQYPPLVGTGIAVEALPIPEIVEPSRELLGAFGFTGVSEIEYKRDERDGKLYLVEINPRHWDQHRLGTKVGVNLSEAAYRDVTGQPARPMFQTPRSALWLAEQGFAYHLRRVLLRRAPARQLVQMLGPRCTWAVLDWRDPAPFLSLLGLWRSQPRETAIPRSLQRS